MSTFNESIIGYMHRDAAGGIVEILCVSCGPATSEPVRGHQVGGDGEEEMCLGCERDFQSAFFATPVPLDDDIDPDGLMAMCRRCDELVDYCECDL